ncbi:MAG: hypothetical protein R3B90_22355 [Planctomycetaceae bacterium]
MYLDCLWDDWNTEKLASHDVTIEEFEEAVLVARRIVRSTSTNRPGCFAHVRGRLLRCVWEEIDESTIYPITAFEVEQ